MNETTSWHLRIVDEFKFDIIKKKGKREKGIEISGEDTHAQRGDRGEDLERK